MFQRVIPEGPRRGVQILDPSGNLEVGSIRMPLIGPQRLHVFDGPPFERALMGVDYRAGARLSDVTVHALNAFHGFRTPRIEETFMVEDTVIRMGWNGLADGNDYLQHLPDTLALTVTTGASPHAGAAVHAFRDEGRDDYWDEYAPHPTWSGTADSTGTVRIPVSVLEPNPLPGLASIPSTAIIRVISEEGAWGYGYLPLYYLNQAWLEGEREVAAVTVWVPTR